MKTTKNFLFAVFMMTAAGLCAEPVIKLVQPYEGAKLPSVNQSFVFGSVQPATATLSINGISVKPHSNGGFLAMIPMLEGPFKIEAIATDGISTATITRSIVVDGPTKPLPLEHGKIIPLSPRNRLVVRPDEIIRVSFQAAPKGKAEFKIQGVPGQFPMIEQSTGLAGIYEGVYRVQPEDRLENADIVFLLQRSDGKKLTEKSDASVTVQRRTTPRYVDVVELATLYTGPGSDFGYDLTLHPGVRLEVTGEANDFLRVSLGRQDEGWIKRSVAVECAKGTPPARSISRNIRVNSSSDSTTIELPLQYRHAFRVQQFINPHRLNLTLYGVIADTDRIRYKTDSAIREMTWLQSQTDTYTLAIETDQSLAWGYDVRYDGNKLIFELRHKPKLTPTKQQPLKGLRIAIDAGHSTQSYGTIGPLGNTEAAVNLSVANITRKELEARGAEVIMIQDGTRDPSLQERVQWAWNGKVHLYLSFHCDAVGEGSDPREHEGYSVHYFHPQSRSFAEEVYDIYQKRSNMRDQGLWRSNLAVCRATQFPSILFEIGFLIVPEIEEKLISPGFQRVISGVVADSVQRLFDYD